MSLALWRAVAPLAAVLALGASAPTRGATGLPAPQGYEVVKLPAGSARLRAGAAVISLSAGSPAWSIPLETPVSVVSGGIWAQFGEVVVKAWPGDALRFHAVGAGVQVEAAAGKLLIERPDGSTRQLEPGQSFLWASPAAPAPAAWPSGGGCGAPVRRAG